jgi:hypothetical protein
MKALSDEASPLPMLDGAFHLPLAADDHTVCGHLRPIRPIDLAMLRRGQTKVAVWRLQIEGGLSLA